jgi:hypothetical protein
MSERWLPVVGFEGVPTQEGRGMTDIDGAATCPHCGQLLCCALMAEHLSDTEWENAQ